MSSNDIAISARGLGKSYVIQHKEAEATAIEAMAKYILNPFRRPEREEIWSLKDVDFDIQRGDIVGVIGRNGAGKSTLLKVLSRITAPTTGEARIAGRVGSLIEVGTGFQPELTGRENIYLNGAILGMRRSEIARRFDEIVDFSGVERFLDTPVKRYSSGMYVRLAFAVAAHLDTEILLIDEVLSVGDAEFQKKSLGKIGDIANTGRTVLFVSHNTATMEALCKTGLLMHKGRLVHAGPLKETLAEYHKATTSALSKYDTTTAIDFAGAYKHFKTMDLIDEMGQSTRSIAMGTPLRLNFRIDSIQPMDYPSFMVFIDSTIGQRILTVASARTERAIRRMEGVCDVSCVIDHLPLSPGDYTMRLALWKSGEYVEETDYAMMFTVRDADTFKDGWGASSGVCIADSDWTVREAEPAASAVGAR